MKTLTIFLVIVLSACSTNQGSQTVSDSSTVSTEPPASMESPTSTVAPVSTIPPASRGIPGSDTITIKNLIPYRDPSTIAMNIKSECQIGQQLSEFIQSHTNQIGMNVSRAEEINKKGPGKVLIVEITSAISAGHAFIGHSKSTAIAGQLYDNGEQVSSFTAMRVSMGGFFGGFKGSCSVLGRTVKTLGKDVAGWLMNPIDGVHLGN